MSSLSEFQDLVNDIKDEELLNVAEGLLRDMIAIQDMKEKIEKLEEGLSEGKRAAFWFFAMGLDREQIDLATNAIIGKRRSLKDQAERTHKDDSKKVSETKEEALTI
jgi:hypothetical protein